MRKEEGFTLLEIITVLMLLGILAGVATPKFFDMRSMAEKKAVSAALSEAQVRINATYSKAIYAGLTCADAVKMVSRVSFFADENEAKGARIGGFYFTPKDEEITPDGLEVSIQVLDAGTVYSNFGKLYVPSCIEPEVDDEPLPAPDGDGGSGSDSSGDTDSGSTGTDETDSSGGTTDSSSGTTTDGDATGGSSGSSGGQSSGMPADFPTASAWPAACQYCEAGLVLSSNGNYYAVTSYASFTDDELKGDIESSTSFISGAVVKLNFSEWPTKKYDDAFLTEVWNPTLKPGSLVKNASTGEYVIWTGAANTITAEYPWVNSANWQILKSSSQN